MVIKMVIKEVIQRGFHLVVSAAQVGATKKGVHCWVDTFSIRFV
jgi:hypothetical protein